MKIHPMSDRALRLAILAAIALGTASVLLGLTGCAGFIRVRLPREAMPILVHPPIHRH